MSVDVDDVVLKEAWDKLVVPRHKYIYHISWVYWGVLLDAVVVATSCEAALEMLVKTPNFSDVTGCVKIGTYTGNVDDSYIVTEGRQVS